MISRIKNIFSNKEKRQKNAHHSYDLELVYIDKLGNKWWSLKDVENIPTNRQVYMNLQKTYLDIGVDAMTIRAANKQTRILAEQGESELIADLWDTIEKRMSFSFNERNIIEFGVSMYTINDEPVYEVSDYYQNKKIEAIAKDAAAKRFFLPIFFEICKRLIPNYRDYSQIELLELIKQEKVYQKFFGSFQ